MAKICYPSYRKFQFSSLSQWFEYFDSKDRYLSPFTLCEIVQYNPCYRDLLRSDGLDAVINRLVSEAPGILEKPQWFESLKNAWKDNNIADYDIQCIGIHRKVTILGYTFNGLEEIRSRVEMFGFSHYNNLLCKFDSQQSDKIGVHIGCISRDYPKFDEFDASDNRQFQNYIFKTEPLTEEMMIEAHRIPARTNFCMVNEDIPESELPVLYYSGSGKYMFLATKKRKRG